MSDVFPTEIELTESEAEALSGTNHQATGLPILAAGIGTGSSPSLEVQFNRMFDKLLSIVKNERELQVVKTGALAIGVFPGDYTLGGTRKRFAGNTSQALTDNATNYVYLDASNALTVSTSSFGAVNTTWPLAEIVTASGAITSITDRRNYARNALPTSTSSSDTGTNETSFKINEDGSASAGVDTMVEFERGTDNSENAALVYVVSTNKFELRTQETTGTLAPVNVEKVQISGTDMVDSDGAAKVASAVAGAGLSHSSGVLSCKTLAAKGTGISDDTLTVAVGTGVQIGSNGVEVSLSASGGLETTDPGVSGTLQLKKAESHPHHQGTYDATKGGAALLMVRGQVSSGANATIFNANAPYKFRVIDAWSINESANGGTWKVDDGTNDITDTVTVGASDTDIDRATQVNDANSTISTNGTLRIVATGSLDATIFVVYERVA